MKYCCLSFFEGFCVYISSLWMSLTYLNFIFQNTPKVLRIASVSVGIPDPKYLMSLNIFYPLQTGQQVTTFNPGKIHLKKLTQSSFIHNFHFGKPQLTTINTMRLRFLGACFHAHGQFAKGHHLG